MTREPPPYDSAATLPAYRAFVVHFITIGRGARFAGRAEHLTSGTITHFASLRELMAFFDRVLDPLRKA